MNFNNHDMEVLRKLAARKVAIACNPENLERKQLWLNHDESITKRPMVLIDTESVKDKHRPVPDAVLECRDEFTRNVERILRREIYRFEILGDDHVVEPYFNVNWKIDAGNYGVAIVKHSANAGVLMGAQAWDAPIKDIDRDFHLLKPRQFRVDREKTLAEKETLEKLFGGILPARIRGANYWTMGMTITAMELIGLENLMLFMFDNPDGLHRLMRFLRDDHAAFTEWLEKEGLYSLNNENDCIGSGSMGYTRALPQPDWKTGDKVRKKDLWVLSESQETVGVSPELFEKFIFPLQLDLVRGFGRTYYGCCEQLHSKIHIIKKIPNLKRVSVSAWADEEKMASELGKKIVYSRKPNPTLISTENFDENLIRKDIRKTLSIAKNCNLEIIMRAVHTLNEQPQRASRWVAITFEEINKFFG